MYVVRNRLHPVRKALRIDHNICVRVARYLPAVVDDNVLIAGVLHARLDHGIGHTADQFVTHVTSELVPCVPTHGRSEGQTFGDRIVLRQSRNEE